MPRFFVNRENIYTDRIIIKGQDVKHIKKVLRLRCGEELVLCDGEGQDYDVVIEKMTDQEILTSINRVIPSISEPKLEVTLYQGIPKSDKMDLIIQKSVELGVKKIVPVITGRTVVKLGSTKNIEKRTDRWQRISKEAAKQCGRGIIPKVCEPVNFECALDLCSKSDLKIMPYEKQTTYGIKEYIGICGLKTAAVFIGPEGGFEDNEITKAHNFDVKTVTLGSRILRTETAAIAVLSILMYETGDI